MADPFKDADRQVVVTGIGPVTPIGTGLTAFYQGLCAEKSAITRLAEFDTSQCKAKHGATVEDFQPEEYFAPHRLKRLDRYAQFSLVAAKLAMENAGVSPEDVARLNHSRCGVIFGTALGGISDAEAEHSKFLQRGPKAVHRSLALQIFGGAAHSNIAIEYGFTGVSTTNSNSCASGNVAIGEAFRLIRSGHLDLAIAGAAESPIAPLTFSAFDNISTMSQWDGEPPEVACRPFDRCRDGFVMGEGACAFVLEEKQQALQRGAHIFGEIRGFSHNNEAYHMTTPRPGGELVASVMRNAIEEAGLGLENVDYINGHASSTLLNDANEAQAIVDLFGEHAQNLAVSGTKAYTGHALGAASAIEFAICLLAMEHGFLPPTLHLEESEEALAELGLDFVPKHRRSGNVRACLNNAFGFGGINSCVAVVK